MEKTKNRNRSRRLLALLPLLLLLPGSLPAWSEHAVCTYPALSVLPEIKNAPPVRVESLEDFLRAEAKGLVAVLEKEEAWARAHVPEYPPRSDALAFRPEGNQAILRENFLRSIRVNPNIRLLLFIQNPPGGAAGARPRLDHKTISLYKDPHWLATIDFRGLKPGDTVSALEVIASASDEPDYGHDITIWADNETEYGKAYGFGEQPFGNPAYEYATQAPFHMGFFHEAALIYAAAGFIKRTYPEYRIHLYQTLARYAFETGHPYWGYRFMGWGLHYVGDLTQPYHSRLLPGIGTLHTLWINIKHMLGFSEDRRVHINLVSNRHTAIERYQRSLMVQALRENPEHPVLMAARDTSGDEAAGQWSDATPRDLVSRNAEARADHLDDLLGKWMPDRFVNDPDFVHGNDEEEVFREVSAGDPKATRQISTILQHMFREYGTHSRNFVRATMTR